MNLRRLALSVATLVALCLAVWLVRRPAAPVSTDARIGQPVLAPDLAADLTRLELADGGKTVALARQADGTWTVPDYHDFPADFAKLTRLVADLTEARIQRLVTTRPERLARLEFKDTTLTFHGAAGRTPFRLTLGKTADGGGRFVRFGEEEKGYLANLNSYADAEPKNWADATLLSLKPAEIAAVEIGFADGAPVTATRAKPEEAWVAASAPAGQRLKADRINSLLTTVGSLRFTDTTAPDDAQAVAARAHPRTLKLTTFGGQTYTLTFARRPEEKRPKPPAAETKSPATEVVPATEAPTPAAPAEAPAPPPAAAPAAPEFETIPAGPVFVAIKSSESAARLNALMEQRAFQIAEWIYTGLPAAAADFWEPVPSTPTPGPKPAPPETGPGG